MKKKDYVKPNAQVLSLYTDEFMEGGFHAQSGIRVVLPLVMMREIQRRIIQQHFKFKKVI